MNEDTQAPQGKYRCYGAYHDPPVCNFRSDIKWTGPCPGCGRFYKIVAYDSNERMRRTYTAVSKVPPLERISSGIPSFDRVTGGGFAKGRVMLFAGTRGSGKSTLLMMAANHIARDENTVLYASAEESAEEVVRLATRIKISNSRIKIRGLMTEIEEVFEHAKELLPKLIVFDSLQTFSSRYLEDVGRREQGIAVAKNICDFCDKTSISAVAINHMTSGMDFTGGTEIQHLVHSIMMLVPYSEKDDGKLRRCMSEEEFEKLRNRKEDVKVLASGGKNRGGPVSEKAFFEISETGLRPIAPYVNEKAGPPPSTPTETASTPSSQGQPDGESTKETPPESPSSGPLAPVIPIR